MGAGTKLDIRVVDSIPDDLKDWTLYISFEYATAIHLRCCGCGQEVVTSLSTRKWQLLFDGSVSLHPSIGNWSFPCQSHYWIRDGHIVWSETWSAEEIASLRRNQSQPRDGAEIAGLPAPIDHPKSPSILGRIRRLFGKWKL